MELQWGGHNFVFSFYLTSHEDGAYKVDRKPTMFRRPKEAMSGSVEIGSERGSNCLFTELMLRFVFKFLDVKDVANRAHFRLLIF